jgi:hypothetical protein
MAQAEGMSLVDRPPVDRNCQPAPIMKHLHPLRGFAVETAILLVALFGGAGFFGVKEVKRALHDHDVNNKLERAEKAEDEAIKKANSAMKDRDDANQKLELEKTTRAAVEKRQVDIARTIQRSSAEGTAAVEQLPQSVQQKVLTFSFDQIDDAAEGLAGKAPAADVRIWRERALSALAGNQRAMEDIENQKKEIADLKDRLATEKTAHDKAQKEATDANRLATDSQRTGLGLQALARDRLAKVHEAVGDVDVWKDLANGLGLIVICVAGLWLLGLGLKIFAIGKGEGKFSNALHTAADTFHSILAPMSVLSQTHARRETDKIVDSAGAFMHDVRTKLPKDVAEKVTDIMDISMAPKHQDKIRTACRKRVIPGKDAVIGQMKELVAAAEGAEA